MEDYLVSIPWCANYLRKCGMVISRQKLCKELFIKHHVVITRFSPDNHVCVSLGVIEAYIREVNGIGGVR